MTRIVRCTFAILFLASTLAGCAAPNPQLAAQCEYKLKVAEQMLSDAKAKGLSDAAEITKATALISAAHIQLQFNKYPNCINKAERAMQFIRATKAK